MQMSKPRGALEPILSLIRGLDALCGMHDLNGVNIEKSSPDFATIQSLQSHLSQLVAGDKKRKWSDDGSTPTVRSIGTSYKTTLPAFSATPGRRKLGISDLSDVLLLKVFSYFVGPFSFTGFDERIAFWSKSSFPLFDLCRSVKYLCVHEINGNCVLVCLMR